MPEGAKPRGGSGAPAGAPTTTEVAPETLATAIFRLHASAPLTTSGEYS